MQQALNTPLIITLATQNEGKRQELSRFVDSLNLPIQLAINPEAGEIEETGDTFLANALLKAQQTPPVAGSEWVLAEDSGLVVDALDGRYGLSPFPGLHSNRWLTVERRDEILGQSYPNRMALDRTSASGVTNSDLCHALLTLMQGKTNRAARYACGMVLYNGVTGQTLEALDYTELQIIEGELRGLNGFGYDPITVPLNADGQPGTRTTAELTPQEKNQISHRGKAFQQILSQLQAQSLLPVG